jgi:hypothetical protein
MVTETMGFRLRGHWAEATLREARAAVPPSPEEPGSAMRDLLEATREVTQSVMAMWGKSMARLERTGIPADLLADLAEAARGTARLSRESLQLLGPHAALAGWHQDDIDDLTAMLLRIERQAESLLASARSPLPPIDPVRLQESLRQAERGEGEDAADILARLRTGGEL